MEVSGDIPSGGLRHHHRHDRWLYSQRLAEGKKLSKTDPNANGERPRPLISLFWTALVSPQFIASLQGDALSFRCSSTRLHPNRDPAPSQLGLPVTIVE